MADWPVKSLGDKTLPAICEDALYGHARPDGTQRRLQTEIDGFHPRSEVANLSFWVTTCLKCTRGRGARSGKALVLISNREEMAMRCNLICIDGRLLKTTLPVIFRRKRLMCLFNICRSWGDKVCFHTGVLTGIYWLSKAEISVRLHTASWCAVCNRSAPLLVKPLQAEAEDTASLINELILKSQELWKLPINQKRIADGKDPANSIWPWSPGYRPQMETLSTLFRYKVGSGLSRRSTWSGDWLLCRTSPIWR